MVFDINLSQISLIGKKNLKKPYLKILKKNGIIEG